MLTFKNGALVQTIQANNREQRKKIVIVVAFETLPFICQFPITSNRNGYCVCVTKSLFILLSLFNTLNISNLI